MPHSSRPSGRVRPYARTTGRTRPSRTLALETLISTSDRAPVQHMTRELGRISRLCRTPRSVAEIAADLQLPLGVAQVLVADGVEAGMLRVHPGAATLNDRPSLELMQRVLNGLHRL